MILDESIDNVYLKKHVKRPNGAKGREVAEFRLNSECKSNDLLSQIFITMSQIEPVKILEILEHSQQIYLI